MVKNLPSNEGDTGLIPDQEANIPHATGQLNFIQLERACTTTEPICSRARVPQLKLPAFHNWRKPVLCSEDPVQPNKQTN